MSVVTSIHVPCGYNILKPITPDEMLIGIRASYIKLEDGTNMYLLISTRASYIKLEVGSIRMLV
jgi:hypothetical protein